MQAMEWVRRGAMGATLALVATVVGAGEAAVTAPQVVQAMENSFGVHPGERRNHIVGTCASGSFVGSPAASAYTRSALFSGAPVPVVARLSLPGGNPGVPDTARSPRGMALEFRLPDGSLQHMTMLSTPVFGAATPATFLADIESRRPDPATGKPDPARIKAFRAAHPDTQAQADYLAQHNPPPSYANSAFFGIHSFVMSNQAQHSTLVRWRFVPVDGERELSDAELQAAPPRFLQQRLIERVAQGPVHWDMVLTLGQPGDTANDPTQQWPADRQQLTVGRLSFDTASAQAGAPCEAINFDPLVMSDGIAPSSDPVLLFRSPAYAVSFGKRLAGQ